MQSRSLRYSMEPKANTHFVPRFEALSRLGHDSHDANACRVVLHRPLGLMLPAASTAPVDEGLGVRTTMEGKSLLYDMVSRFYYSKLYKNESSGSILLASNKQPVET